MLQTLRQKLKNRQGFTLIELIVVIAIIAILAAVLIPRFTGFTKSANEKAAVSNARNILVAVEAMLAQGDTDILVDEIKDYTGKTYLAITDTYPGYVKEGTAVITNTDGEGLSSDTFDYIYVKGTTGNYTYYKVTVSAGKIQDTVVSSTSAY